MESYVLSLLTLETTWGPRGGNGGGGEPWSARESCRVACEVRSEGVPYLVGRGWVLSHPED